jgi:hypothetical protein
LFCRRPREKRVVRVPAVGDKVSDIPSDSYSWRKYGQKPIKGSPHPRYSYLLAIFQLHNFFVNVSSYQVVFI